MRYRTIATGVLTALALPLWLASPSYADCAKSERIAAECSSVTTTNDGSEVTVGVSSTTPGLPGDSSTSTSSSYSPGWWSPPPIRMDAELGTSECEITVAGLCRGQAPAKTTTTVATQAVPPTPPTHASQLKGFRPQTPRIEIQPNAWSLPTLPINIYASASRHRVSGELLGWPVVVRFTPVAYHWGYGDGSGRSVGVAGGVSALQFSPTATSHRYAKPGRYTVTLQVDYRVEWRFYGGTFDDIDGRVSSRAASKTVEVFTVSPLLEAG